MSTPEPPDHPERASRRGGGKLALLLLALAVLVGVTASPAGASTVPTAEQPDTALSRASAGDTAPTVNAVTAAATWIKGPLRADRVLDCPAQSQGVYRYGDGVSMQVSYLDDPRRIVKVGEVFYARVQIRLITLPCVEVGVLPEFIPPTGLDFAFDAAHPITWSKSGSATRKPVSGDLSTMFAGVGSAGGLLLGTGLPEHQYSSKGAWHLERADGVLEIKVPLTAKRPMKGNLTPVPDCHTTRAGDPGVKFYLPCAANKAGDHLQVRLAIADGGDRVENTTYVGIFAEKKAVVKVRTTTALALSKARAKYRSVVTARVTVAPTARKATGTVSIYEGGKRLVSAGLTSTRNGVITLRLPALRPGTHRLTAKYSGSTGFTASVSTAKTIVVVK